MTPRAGRLAALSNTTIRDTWHTVGLRATASHDDAVEALDIPADRTMAFSFTP